MNMSKERFININKRAILVAIIVYLAGVFSPIKFMQPGLIFAFGAGFFILLHAPYFAPRPRAAGGLWFFVLFITVFTISIPLDLSGEGNPLFTLLTILISLVPCLLLARATTEEKPKKKKRLKVVTFRSLVQCSIFMIFMSVTSFAFINGTRPDLAFWAAFHVSTVALLPFLFGRVICGWICPNATLQDGLLKNMDYRRPIPKLHKAIEAQSNTCAMNISGVADKNAPLMPATLLLAWFPVFFAETIFDLTQLAWWPVVFIYSLMFCSILFPWRKLCTHFCFLSSYRGLAANASLWRIRYNKNKCRNCKRCLAEESCPFYINITQQDNEMPTTCCLCFSCMEACPFDDVL
ncbi:MAG: 4Fe-4S binding protein, partial [Deltaproteobacteria bacterium]|nr:4Fe-4S binding protein [Deltaproteobacteria bacterium]